MGTRLRHSRRNADTEENQRARGAAAQALIAQEKESLAAAGFPERINDEHLGQRKVTISVPSCFGNLIASLWGRHTIYEVDLADKRNEIVAAFEELAAKREQDKEVKLRSFPQEKPSFATRLKRDIFFAAPVIRFLRRHMMGRADKIHLHTQDLFKYLKSSKGAHLNYTLLDNKIVFAWVKANGDNGETHRKLADWALSKHALLANREEVNCSGEIWYDEEKNRFMLNDDSGTYKPDFERVKVVAELANRFFDAEKFGNVFEAVTVNHEPSEVA